MEVVSSLALSSSFFSSLFSLGVSSSFGGGDFGVAVLSLPFFAGCGDIGALAAAATPLVLAEVADDEGEVDGDRFGAEVFLPGRLPSPGSCVSIFSGEAFIFREGDLTRVRSSEVDLFRSLSLFFVTVLLSCLIFGFTASSLPLVGGAPVIPPTTFSSIDFTALDTRGAFIAVVTSGDGVGVCVDSRGDGEPSSPEVVATEGCFTLVEVLAFETGGRTGTEGDTTGGVGLVDVTTAAAVLAGSAIADEDDG